MDSETVASSFDTYVKEDGRNAVFQDDISLAKM